jgi:transposase InsO family protein
MGSVGDSYDNALMENFWSTLKIELVYRNAWRTRDAASTTATPGDACRTAAGRTLLGGNGSAHP